MTNKHNCLICEKHNQQNNDTFLYIGGSWAIYAGPFNSQVEGYLYLEPLRHVEEWQELNEKELQEMALLLPRVEKILKKIVHLERLYVVTISEVVRHLHLHLIPRLKNEETRGVKLIEQATQQKSSINRFDMSTYEKLISYLKNEFESEGNST
ncbi:HIT domain-containing protein [Paenibacillus campinasensis]|uniref:HIT domain-containing protein n=1 Tax=Paenibacillus campinasensis TaxID=66347 RepID=A0ABW9T5J0_9BACL|nr:HIT domain-containing protein [Paenibacillus campinasensis]MUG68369.1 HIT domain-containing protein [Paenibacillus campinasensis]